MAARRWFARFYYGCRKVYLGFTTVTGGHIGFDYGCSRYSTPRYGAIAAEEGVWTARRVVHGLVANVYKLLQFLALLLVQSNARGGEISLIYPTFTFYLTRFTMDMLNSQVRRLQLVNWPLRLNQRANNLIVARVHLHRRQEEERQNKRRSCWIRRWIQRRERLGVFTRLLVELDAEDSKALKNFLRMPAVTF